MIDALIAFSLRRWPLILILAGLLAAAGLVAFRELPIDAFPDVTNIQVQILTEGPGLSPIEVERFVTIPLELQMTGLPDLTEIRSLSKFALSQTRSPARPRAPARSESDPAVGDRAGHGAGDDRPR